MIQFFDPHPFPAASEISDEELAEVGTILNMWRKFDLSVYKETCMKRRVAIRMRSARCRDVAEYCCLLRQSEQELDLLLKVLTIHVSQFFRNPSMYDKLRLEILPGLFNGGAADNGGGLSFWCLGCAGGEEPYSLAIMLREYFARELLQTRVTITGTDIDEGTLASARRGEYGEERLKEVSPELRERYFERHGNLFRLIPGIRDMVTFQQGNIMSIPRHRASNLVFCRNTLIYFTRPDQERILNGIAAMLPPGGILVLGKSETMVGEARRRFTPVCPVERIYRKI